MSPYHDLIGGSSFHPYERGHVKRSIIAGLTMLAATGCGKKHDNAVDAMTAMATAATAAPKIEQGMKEAEQFQKDRIARGDTLAMPYAELQKFLPSSVSGYTAREEPAGSQQAMPGFSMSQASQTWVATPNPTGMAPEVEVTVVDFGGTQQGYAMMAAPMLMGFSQEDAHRRVGAISIDVPNTGAWQEFDKDSKDAKVTAVARYRFLITVDARNKGEDQSALAKELASEIARKFDGK